MAFTLRGQHWPEWAASLARWRALNLPFPLLSWGVENIPVAPSGALTWKTQYALFQEER